MQQIKKISKTTLCCIDCINHDLTIRALRTSMASCSFERVVFLTDRFFELPGIETIQIPALNSRDAYSAFVLHALADYIETEFVLIIQWDGYVINSAAWHDEFLQHDYIGAVWGHLTDTFRVGNGGFSLRSKKLLSACRQIALEGETLNEDDLVCRKHRCILEREFGIRFAPEKIAERFSFELTYPGALPFGFHGLFNIWLVLPLAETARYIAALPSNVVASVQFLRLGLNYCSLRQFRFAEMIFRRILALAPGHMEAKRHLAALERKPLINRPIRRIEPCPCNSGQRYKNCCGTDPGATVARGATRAEDIQWLLAVAIQHHQQGRVVHAAAIYRMILDEQPDNAIARQYVGVIAHQSGDHSEAIRLIEQAILVQPGIPDFHNNLGLVFQAQGDFPRAFDCYRHAIELDPSYVEAYSNLGLALQADRRDPEAIPYFEQAILLQPDFAQAHWNLSISLLVTGNFERGWSEYEWRLKTHELAGTERRFVQPFWQGERLDGKTILLHAEQGFGDSIQFIRYVPLIAQRGGRVVVECRPGLKKLFETVRGIAQVIDRGEPLPAFDVHCAQLSLPSRFNASNGNIPADTPYFYLEPSLSARWRARMPDSGGKAKIGLAWAGNPDHSNDRHRSISPDHFSALAATGGAVFFSLQKSAGASRAPPVPPPVSLCDLTEQVDDFADMAALISNLDLVICVDTSVAHLAGALGKPVWVLLPYASDWRWQLGREDSPWYPSMRLFRQRQRGDWDDVLRRIGHALHDFQIALSGDVR
jgi:tetratricopeptide (TPR) repeat protein